MDPSVSIIIVNYNGRHLLDGCLKSVHGQSCQDIEVILVDNGSTDGSIEFVRDSFPDVAVVSLPENAGFADANLEGLRRAKGDYILLVNNDVELDMDCVHSLLTAMKGHPEVGICAAKMIVHGSTIIDSAGDGFAANLKGFKRGEGRSSASYGNEEYIFGACAGAALYRRKMLDEIGFLDKDFFLIHEDTDLNFRAQLAGWKVLYIPAAIAYHKVRSSIGDMSDLAIYHTLRNSEYVRIKNIPLSLFLRYLPAFTAGTVADFLYFAIKHRRARLYLKAKIDVFKNMRGMLEKRKTIKRLRKVDDEYLRSIITPLRQEEFLVTKACKFFKKS